MKIKTKRNYLLGFLLSTFLIIGIINVTIGEKTIIDTKPDISKLHTISLRSLFLGSGDFDTGFSWMRVNTGGSSLDVLNGLIVGKNNSAGQWVEMVAIGGGAGNSVEDSNAGIAGGKNNKVSSENGAIGGGAANYVEGGVVAGGGNNSITDIFGVILGGRRNNSSGGVILGGIKNRAGKYALALGSGARGEDGAFAWNGYAGQNSARINASGGMLIGTNTPVSGVYLVVDGSVKLGSGNYNTITGGVWVNENGCIKASDGDSVYTLGRSSESVCGVDSGCQFGTTILHNGDKVTAYTVSYAKKCEDIAQTVTCKGGKFYNSGGSIMNVVYPYCYDLSPDPILTLTGGIKQCSGLPANAKWVNGYFKQKLENGKWTPEVKTGVYSSDPSVECSFTCESEEYEYNYGKNTCEKIYQCTGTPPSHATLLAGSDNGLTVNTERKLYASATEANGKKCAYLCDTGSNYYYDGGRCKFISDFCLPEVYGCLMPATATHTGYSDNKYTWDCKIDGISEPVEVGCFLTLQCHHCSKSGFPYCFPINFDSTCNEGNYLN